MDVAKAKIFKCYSAEDKPQNMLFIYNNQIIKITPKTMQDGRNKLFVEYYDDRFCVETMLICEEIVTIDPDDDDDYKIWKNS